MMRPIPNSYCVAEHTLFAGEYPGSAPFMDATAAEEKLAKFLDLNITVFVDLTQHDELNAYHDTLTTLASERGIDVIHDRRPIKDSNICSEQQMCDTLDAIDAHHAAGRNVYVHCWGGIGRTGMTIGCWMVRHGHSADDALAIVEAGFSSMLKRVRMKEWSSPETAEQVRVVREWKEGL